MLCHPSWGPWEVARQAMSVKSQDKAVEVAMATTVKRNEDEYFNAALSLDPKPFLPYLEKNHNMLYKSYEKLVAKNGMSEAFEENPLAFMILRNDICCVHAAREYIDLKLKEQEGQIEQNEEGTGAASSNAKPKRKDVRTGRKRRELNV